MGIALDAEDDDAALVEPNRAVDRPPALRPLHRARPFNRVVADLLLDLPYPTSADFIIVGEVHKVALGQLEGDQEGIEFPIPDGLRLGDGHVPADPREQPGVWRRGQLHHGRSNAAQVGVAGKAASAAIAAQDNEFTFLCWQEPALVGSVDPPSALRTAAEVWTQGDWWEAS